MASRLNQVITFPGVAPGASLAVAHSININGVALLPDLIFQDATGFVITTSSPTSITVRNDNPVAATLNMWLMRQHSIDRVYGAVQITDLTPQPFIAVSPGSGVAVEDEGIPITTIGTMNFVGAGVTATDAGGGQVDVNIPGGMAGGIDVQEEGAPVVTATVLDFVGAGVTATDAGGGVAAISIPGPELGNIVTVDQTFGDDATGQREGLPFLTVAAALMAALPGDAVQVRPGTYDLAAALTIPAGVILIGAGPNVTTLRMLGVIAPITLITLGLGSGIEALTLELSSAVHVDLTGIDFPLTTSLSARVRDIQLLIDNSGAGAGSSDVIGVRSDGTGISGAQIVNVLDSNIRVMSTGGGRKRGILVDGANTLTVTNAITTVTGAGAGTFYAAETSNVAAILLGRGIIANGSGADISQTSGSLIVDGASDLVNVNANGLGFGVLFHPTVMQFGDPGALPNAPRYLYPGTNQASLTPVLVRVPSSSIAKSISLRATMAPGGVDTCTVTLIRNGIDTPLVVILTGAQVSNVNKAVSEGFNAGDDLSVRVDDTGATEDIMVVLELF